MRSVLFQLPNFQLGVRWVAEHLAIVHIPRIEELDFRIVVGDGQVSEEEFAAW